MSHALTAEDLFAEMKTMPATERSRFFAMLGEVLFQGDDSSHEQLFGHLAEAEFTATEAAEYLEVSIPTFRRYVQGGKLKPTHRVGRSQMFAARDLKAFKRSLRDVKRDQ
jgi:excisionase family DNA binding protein